MASGSPLPGEIPCMNYTLHLVPTLWGLSLPCFRLLHHHALLCLPALLTILPAGNDVPVCLDPVLQAKHDAAFSLLLPAGLVWLQSGPAKFLTAGAKLQLRRR